MEKRAVTPVLSSLAVIGSAIVHRLGHFGHVRAPAESAALIDRVKGVENNERACQRHPGFGDAPAIAGHDLAFAAADQPGLSYPPGKLGERRFIHLKALRRKL